MAEAEVVDAVVEGFEVFTDALKEGAFTLTPIDLGRRTRFIWAETLVFPWWLGGPVGAFIGGKVVLRSIWKRNLRNLKRLVEG